MHSIKKQIWLFLANSWIWLFYLVPIEGLANVANDSLVYFAELQFHSDLERKTFRQLQKQPDGLGIELFLSVSQNQKVAHAQKGRQQLQTSVNQWRTKKFERAKPEKKIKMLYQEVHTTWLKKYTLENRFSEIFDEGVYNCVSASALYAMVFEQLNIPYTIKEAPTHVYLVAYPEQEPILIETTDPVVGYFEMNAKFQKAFIDNLLKTKSISQKEYDQKSIAELFDAYYFDQEDIDLKQLAGLQYLNVALYHMEKEQQVEAFRMLEKAYWLYPSERIAGTLLYVGGLLLAGEDFADLESLQLLTKLMRYESYGWESDLQLSAFENITQYHIVDRSNKAIYDSAYHLLTYHTHDSIVQREMDFIYNLYRGRQLVLDGSSTEAITYLEKAYAIKPEHSITSAIFIQVLMEQLTTFDESASALDYLDSYLIKYPSLKEHRLLSAVLLNIYVSLFGAYYGQRQPKKAEHYRQLFVNMYESQKGLKLMKDEVGSAYSKAAVFYFKQGNYQRTRKLLQEGLKYAPGNEELNYRLRALE